MMSRRAVRAFVLLVTVGDACAFTTGPGAFIRSRHVSQRSAPPLVLRQTRLIVSGSNKLFMQQQVKDKDEAVQEKQSVNTKATSSQVFDNVKGSDGVSSQSAGGLLSYGDFAKKYPFANNVAIATTKTAAADLMAQVVIAQTPLSEVDWARNLLFCAFGAIYLGGFQYLYQVQVFKKLFDIDSFTSQPWQDKLRDTVGLRNLAAQTALDLAVLTAIYLPTFYIFKAGVFSGSVDPSVWASTGLANYQANFAKDELDLIRVWLPADLVCFSVPLYLRLPVRHIVSFVWTAYLSFARGGH